MPKFYEFFAGAGMARAGLGKVWSCVFANDIDCKKAQTYALNWGEPGLHCGDVAQLSPHDLPGVADLAWASFPCQDLSLAGSGAGLDGERSGTFWAFWRLIRELRSEGRAPSAIVLENVRGALTSHGGRDFVAIAQAVGNAGYRIGAVLIDAVRFVPQSRPRLFIVAVREELWIPPKRIRSAPDELWHASDLVRAYRRLPETMQASWLWWNIPRPAEPTDSLADLIEAEPVGVTWHSPAETRRLLEMMSPVNRAKVEAAQAAGHPIVGSIYRRTRRNEEGRRIQRAEVRFDGIAGCLRTPQGGSSRQTILLVDGSKVSSRLLSPREAARLMGLPDDYRLPSNYNEAYHLAGDGVVVPAVRHLAEHILEPILAANTSPRKVAA